MQSKCNNLDKLDCTGNVEEWIMVCGFVVGLQEPPTENSHQADQVLEIGAEWRNRETVFDSIRARINAGTWHSPL